MRLFASAVLLAVAIALLHQHPAWHATDKVTSCPAAAWHAGAILKGDSSPALAVALVVRSAPPDAPQLARRAPAQRTWSSRAPPVA